MKKPDNPKIANPEIQDDKLEVSIGKPGDLTDEEINAFARSIVDSLFVLLDLVGKESRMKIKDVITDICKRVRLKSGGKADELSWKIAEAVYPSYTRNDSFRSHQNFIKELLDAGELMIGKVNGHVVGIVGFNKLGEWGGREIKEIRSITVLKEHREKGYFKAITDAVMLHLLKTNPECLIVARTKKPIIKNYMRKYFPGTQEIPFSADTLIINQIKKGYGEQIFNRLADEGYVLLWYDPLINPPDKSTRLDQIQPVIGRYNTWLLNKDEIKKYVEFPLQNACEIFWDKNIKTSGSSANKLNVKKNYPAFISLDYLSLSPENQKYVEKLVKEGKAKMIWNDTAVGLMIPIKENSTSEEVTEAANKVAESFKDQPPNWVPINPIGVKYLSQDHKKLVEDYQEKDHSWVPHYSLKQLIRDKLTDDGRVASDFDKYNPDYDKTDFWVKEKGYYYDKESDLFYLSEKDCKKYKLNNI
jgi:hypothetical protein